MFSTRIAKITTAAVAAGAFGLAALAGTATAHAGSVDDQFITNIEAADIYYDSTADAVADAKLVCSMLAAGNNGVTIGNQILADTDLTTAQAATFVVESAGTYCPRYWDQVTA